MFFYFLNLIFCKRNNAKIPFNYFSCSYYYIIIFLYQTVILQNKNIYMDIYGHISYIIIFIYVCIYLYIFLYDKFFAGYI